MALESVWAQILGGRGDNLVGLVCNYKDVTTNMMDMIMQGILNMSSGLSLFPESFWACNCFHSFTYKNFCVIIGIILSL